MPQTDDWDNRNTRFPILLATWFGCGYSRIGPGTVGSLGALIPAWLLSHYLSWPVFVWPLCAIAITAPAIWAADVTAKRTGTKDPGLVVIDEVAGQWLTLGGVHAFGWKTALGAFVLFRLFDIWKPPPVRQLERLPGGIGIVADDLMAGLYGAGALWLAGGLLPGSLQ